MLDQPLLVSGFENRDGSPTTDCRREEIWVSANRRKVMNGFSVSVAEGDGFGGGALLLGSVGESDVGAMPAMLVVSAVY
jgi:hypothetical protein